jgi:hypothetical protein
MTAATVCVGTSAADVKAGPRATQSAGRRVKVGAGGVEPPSSSVSDPTSHCRHVRRTVRGRQGSWESGSGRRCHRPAAPTIRHASTRVVVIPTAVGCCPSAARRTEADLRAPQSASVASVPPAVRPVAVGSIAGYLPNISSIVLSRWGLGMTRTWAGRSRRRCSGARSCSTSTWPPSRAC